MDHHGEPVQNADELGEQHTYFALAFQDGHGAVDQLGQRLTVRVEHVGTLALPTGHIVACDPFWLTEAFDPYTTVVPPGHYPVRLSIATFADGDRRVACAMLSFAEREVVRWELALRPGQDPRDLPPGELFGYPVDAGTGCFADQATMEALMAQAGIHDVADWRRRAHGDAPVGPDGQPTPEWLALVGAVYTWNDSFGDDLLAQLEATDYITATVIAPGGSRANLIAFSSGWGDGGYASFFGYDARDSVVCLVTDFHVLQGVTWSSTTR